MYRRAYIGMGSNLGDRQEMLEQAMGKIEEFARIMRVSRFIETAPVDVSDEQGDFLNAVIEIETEQSPKALLASLMQVEEALGRVRKHKNEARLIDLDVLAFEDEVIEEGDLVLPHPRMHQRKFVLAPLIEINPNWFHPVLHKTAEELFDAL